MELKIVEERANPLLKRTEYRFEVEHATAATPTRDEVRSELAKQAKTPKDRIIIERMHARFGVARTEGVGAAYQTKEALQAVVREHIMVRNGLKERAPKGPAAAAPAEAAPVKPAPAAETPAEPKPREEKAAEKTAPPAEAAPKAEKSPPAKAETPKTESAPAAEKPAEKPAAKGAGRPKKAKAPAEKPPTGEA